MYNKKLIIWFSEVVLKGHRNVAGIYQLVAYDFFAHANSA